MPFPGIRIVNIHQVDDTCLYFAADLVKLQADSSQGHARPGPGQRETMKPEGILNWLFHKERVFDWRLGDRALTIFNQ